MARSQSRGTGNHPHDAAYLEWMADNGGLETVSPETDDIPWPAKVKWNGDARSEESPWQIPPPGRRCAGRAYVRDIDGDYVVDVNGKRITRPCMHWPMKGTTVCINHGGGVPRIRRAAVERLACALDAATGELTRLALNARDEKVRLSAIVAIMDRLGVRGGVDLHDVKDPAYLDVLKDIFVKAGAGGEE